MSEKERELNYKSQDRGNSSSYEKYMAGMDAVIVEKIASASAYFPHDAGGTLVDVGMASGTGTYILAKLFPQCKVIGVDINPAMVKAAQAAYVLPNLEFRADDGETLQTLSDEPIIGFFNCSSLHHITSFNQYNPHRAFLTIKRQVELLRPNGVLVIRDFVKPTAQPVVIEFPGNERGLQDAERLQNFSRTARSLSPADETGFPLKKLSSHRFQLCLQDVTEFIRRKDYHEDWQVELQEEYGYFTQIEFESIFADHSLRTIVSSPIHNPWIIKNRYINAFTLFDLAGADIGFPPTNYIIAGEKAVDSGTQLKPIRSLPIQQESFLKIRSFQQSGADTIFDIAHRPNPVVDILPYFTDVDGSLKVVAKHGYPRPIASVIGQNQIIDGKWYSGYMTESITAMVSETSEACDIEVTLQDRAGIDPRNIEAIHHSLTFYPSPGGIDEKVDSFYVELKDPILERNLADLGSFSGFDSSGELRIFDAAQLLNSIQVGALPDYRIELNLYRLFSEKRLPLGRWLNDPLEITTIEKLRTTSLDAALSETVHPAFEATDKSDGFLAHNRVKFYEYNRPESTAILEYIMPSQLSMNTVTVLPAFEYKGRIMIGVEPRYLPVPQLHEGASLLLAAPAFRLPNEVRNFSELKRYLTQKSIGDANVMRVTKLGEKYFPCTGITPEQVYPYLVTLDHPTAHLHWIPLAELLENQHRLRDGHLLLSINRLSHAQGKI